MTENLDGSWSLEEALAKASDPQLWDRYQAEKRQQTEKVVDLRRSLMAELLEKIGTNLFAATPSAMKSNGGWAMLDRAALGKRIANTNDGIDEVRLFAPLKAPNAGEHLGGRGLAEAFRENVLDDPELKAFLKRHGTPECMAGGRSPNWYIDYHWPLDATAQEFQRRLTSTGIVDFLRPQEPAREIVLISELLADRIGALRRLLISGKIQGYGLSASFIESLVPPRLWAHKNLSIDVSNGDLSQGDSKGNFLPLWTGIELRSAITEGFEREEPVEIPASNRKRRPKGQEVERVMKEKEIDVGQLGPKAAASEVMKYVKKPPQSANDVKALETLVRRIWKAAKKTS